jgi:hypothetical protein
MLLTGLYLSPSKTGPSVYQQNYDVKYRVSILTNWNDSIGKTPRGDEAKSLLYNRLVNWMNVSSSWYIGTSELPSRINRSIYRFMCVCCICRILAPLGTTSTVHYGLLRDIYYVTADCKCPFRSCVGWNAFC